VKTSFDSDPRLQLQLLVQQRIRSRGRPMANGLANSFEIQSKLFLDSGALRQNCLTAGVGFKIVSMTHEHETALSPVPPPQERLLRLRLHHQTLREPQDQEQGRSHPDARRAERSRPAAGHEPGDSLCLSILRNVRQCIPVSRRICRRLTPSTYTRLRISLQFSISAYILHGY